MYVDSGRRGSSINARISFGVCEPLLGLGVCAPSRRGVCRRGSCRSASGTGDDVDAREASRGLRKSHLSPRTSRATAAFFPPYMLEPVSIVLAPAVLLPTTMNACRPAVGCRSAALGGYEHAAHLMASICRSLRG